MTDGTLRCTEVDGVPTYWVAGSGTLRASLTFRIGMVDESLSTRGRLHLLEHLALHGRESIRTPVNGQVDLLHTRFDVEGRPDEVGAFLHDICRWLTDPDLSALDHEVRVLRAEDANRRSGPVDQHLIWRYGARGPGLAGYDEFGLYQVTPDHLRELIQRAFTRENASLALSGEPPAGLELPLPTGRRLAIPPATPLAQPMPASFIGGHGVVGLSGTLPRSVAAGAMMRALRRTLHSELRGDAMGYSAAGSYELVDTDRALVFVGMDVLPEASPGLVARVADLVRRLRDAGIPPGDLRDDVDQQLRGFADDPAARWQPFIAARDRLLDGRKTDRAELEADLRDLRVIDVRSAAAEFWHRLLISADSEASHGVLPFLDSIPNQQAFADTDGWHFLAADHPADRRKLVIGRHAASISGSAVEITARYDEVAALLSYPDGGRRLIREDGYPLTIEPTQWQRGPEAVDLIDNFVPAHLTVPLPERPAEFRPQPSPRKVRALLTVFHPAVVVPLILAIGLGGGIALSAASGRLIPLWLGALSIPVAVGYAREWRTGGQPE